MDILERLRTESYYLFHYTLGGPGAPTTQRSRTCGQDYTIEEAFSAARTLVLQDYANLGRSLEKASPTGLKGVVLKIVETEFGYDLLNGHRIVSRYWIHPKAAHAA